MTTHLVYNFDDCNFLVHLSLLLYVCVYVCVCGQNFYQTLLRDFSSFS